MARKQNFGSLMFGCCFFGKPKYPSPFLVRYQSHSSLNFVLTSIICNQTEKMDLFIFAFIKYSGFLKFNRLYLKKKKFFSTSFTNAFHFLGTKQSKMHMGDFFSLSNGLLSILRFSVNKHY